MKFIVYGLVDPRDCLVRYIGKSARGISRAREHLMPCTYERGRQKNTRTYKWIRKIINLGLDPILCILFTCFDEDEAYLEEEKMIKKYKEQLYNHKAGGRGGEGHKHTKEECRKISQRMKGRKVSTKSIEKMKETKRKNGTLHRSPTPLEIAKRVEARKGYRHSEKTKKKISESNMGKIISEESKQKQSRARKGKPATEAQLKNLSKWNQKGTKKGKKIRENMKKARLAKEKAKGIEMLKCDGRVLDIHQAAEELGVQPSYIRKAIKRGGKAKGYRFSRL